MCVVNRAEGHGSCLGGYDMSAPRIFVYFLYIFPVRTVVDEINAINNMSALLKKVESIDNLHMEIERSLAELKQSIRITREQANSVSTRSFLRQLYNFDFIFLFCFQSILIDFSILTFFFNVTLFRIMK